MNVGGLSSHKDNASFCNVFNTSTRFNRRGPGRESRGNDEIKHRALMQLRHATRMTLLVEGSALI